MGDDEPMAFLHEAGDSCRSSARILRLLRHRTFFPCTDERVPADRNQNCVGHNGLHLCRLVLGNMPHNYILHAFEKNGFLCMKSVLCLLKNDGT
jgi:hypothetical protein